MFTLRRYALLEDSGHMHGHAASENVGGVFGARLFSEWTEVVGGASGQAGDSKNQVHCLLCTFQPHAYGSVPQSRGSNGRARYSPKVKAYVDVASRA